MTDSTAPDDPTVREAHRRRALAATWVLVALVVGGVGLAGRLVAEGSSDRVRWRFGDPAEDAALDERGVAITAEVMTSDAMERGWIVSYEYIQGDILFIGYAAVPAERGRALGFGDPIAVEIVPDAPELNRPRGTVKAPQAWVTVLHRRWTRVSRWLSWLALVGVLGALVQAARMLWGPPLPVLEGAGQEPAAPPEEPE